MPHTIARALNSAWLYRIIELCSVLFFLFYSILLAKTVFTAFWLDFSFSNLLILFGIPAFSYVAADFFSGFVHFIGDNFGTPATPFIGPHFIRPFREHHDDPKGITRHDFIEVNGSNCLISLVILIPTYYLLTPIDSFFAWAFGELVLFLLGCIFFTNQIHKWAHADQAPAFARYLQKKNIILSPTHHQVHHTSPYDKYYCITSGWLNAFLTRVSFFEMILGAVRSKK